MIMLIIKITNMTMSMIRHHDSISDNDPSYTLITLLRRIRPVNNPKWVEFRNR